MIFHCFYCGWSLLIKGSFTCFVIEWQTLVDWNLDIIVDWIDFVILIPVCKRWVGSGDLRLGRKSFSWLCLHEWFCLWVGRIWRRCLRAWRPRWGSGRSICTAPTPGSSWTSWGRRETRPSDDLASSTRPCGSKLPKRTTGMQKLNVLDFVSYSDQNQNCLAMKFNVKRTLVCDCIQFREAKWAALSSCSQSWTTLRLILA